MKTILLVDDSDQFIMSFYEKYHFTYEITVADSAAMMDEYLYDEPGALKYDHIILDLDLGLGDYTKAEWATICTEFHNSELFLLDGYRALYGWDYYNKVICTRPKTKSETRRFVLFSGHVDALKRQAPPEQIQNLGNRLVKKGSVMSEEDLMKIINS